MRYIAVISRVTMAIALATLAARAVGQEATITQQQPPMDPVAEGHAAVYLFNASGKTLVGGSQTFKANGRDVVRLGREEYAVTMMAPGTYTFEATGRKKELTLAAGQRYFIVYAYHPGASWAGAAGKSVFFDAVPEDQARELLGKSRRKPVREQ